MQWASDYCYMYMAYENGPKLKIAVSPNDMPLFFSKNSYHWGIVQIFILGLL